MQKHNVCLRKKGWAWLYLAGGGVNWLHGRWGAVKAFIPDHIAPQYRRFILFRCCLDRKQSCTSSTNLTICPIFGTYCTIGTEVPNQREVCMGVLGVYTVLGETTRNPTNKMVKLLDSNRLKTWKLIPERNLFSEL